MKALHFFLNGTDKNPYKRFDLTRNPFPQIAKAEYDAAEKALNSLGADPLKSVDDIRARLSGHFTEEFVESVCARFEPGKMIRCFVEYPGEEQ